jgi:hypothetical protein
LSTYLTELAKESPKEQISIFHDLLKELGTLRRQISKTVAPWAKYFGNFVTSGLSSKDFVHPLSFPAWNTYLRHWITELIGTPLPSTCDDILIALTQIERDEFQTISKIKEQNFIAIVSPGSESKPTGGALKLSCEKSDKSALDNLVITFYHSPAQDNLEMIAPYFAEALSPNLADEPEKLLERLAELFFRANHLSIFERGQAAIIGWLVQGIANSWGYSLRYSDAWTGPNHPNPDQHALSHFSFAKFLEEFKKNVELKKL